MIYTIKEAAKILGCSRQAVEDRIKRGTLDLVLKKEKVTKRYVELPDDVKLNPLARRK